MLLIRGGSPQGHKEIVDQRFEQCTYLFWVPEDAGGTDRHLNTDILATGKECFQQRATAPCALRGTIVSEQLGVARREVVRLRTAQQPQHVEGVFVALSV